MKKAAAKKTSKKSAEEAALKTLIESGDTAASRWRNPLGFTVIVLRHKDTCVKMQVGKDLRCVDTVFNDLYDAVFEKA